MDYLRNYQNWLNNPLLNDEGKTELKEIANDNSQIEYRFGGELSFGTAGMRGIIGMGMNMMNIYTVSRATKGLSEYICDLGQAAKEQGVVISYDTRRKSTEFALISASVLLDFGIKVYLYEKPRPVPMLSFAVRKLNCVAGIMITASHNPKEYNGYKVYGGDGAQMSPEATKRVVAYINQTQEYLGHFTRTFADVNQAKSAGAMLLGRDFEQDYYDKIYALSLSPEAVKQEGKGIKLVYTPVHGTGYEPVCTVLNGLGIHATVVEEQTMPDTEFSTVQVPNPENKETLSLGIKLADKINADVVFGTDPDCDRLGVALRANDGQFVALTGNQVGLLLLDYILLRLKEDNKIRKDSFVVKSFVSAGLAKPIADSYGVELKEVPVGFKFIGEKIKIAEQTGVGDFVFGFEESCGYLRGTHARDKDAVVASMLFAELVCYYNSKKVSVFEVLNNIYNRFGFYLDYTESKAFKGLNAMALMNAAVERVSKQTITSLGGVKVVATRNYETGERTDCNGNAEKIEFSGLNCLYYELEGGGFVCLRPSGTEPKLKIYYSIKGENKEDAQMRYREMASDFEKILQI